jgi:hypothetical protein
LTSIVNIAHDRRLALRGDLLDYTADTGLADRDTAAVRWRPEHWLLIEDGRIVGAQAQDPGPGWERADHRGCQPSRRLQIARPPAVRSRG